MLNEFDFVAFNNPYEDRKLSELGEELAVLQRECAEKNIPVIIMVDGWESSGKGYVINELVRELDAKSCRVHVFERLSHDEKENLYTFRFWRRMPAKGDFAVYDRSMYYHMLNDLECSPTLEDRRIREVVRLERLLYADHTILIKFFLHQTKKMQKKNIGDLERDKYRKFLVSDFDLEQNKHYNKYFEHFSHILRATDLPIAHWHIVSAENRKNAARYVLGKTIDRIKEGLKDIEKRMIHEAAFEPPVYNGPSSLDAIDLTKTLSEEEYDKEIDKLQKKAGDLAYALHIHKVPTVIVFEGMDAAGKGGAIKRLLRQIDPRGYQINPTSAPSDMEKDHHYLWRFYNNMPKDGEMAIFDRSWYGRVMVERVEGFATKSEWARAYTEINEMEAELCARGTLVLKYFLSISTDEQLRRFKDREENKPYKITDEDWRNREKWPAYRLAIDEMLARTDTVDAPWVKIPGEDKRYARVEVLKDFIDRAERKLKALKK